MKISRVAVLCLGVLTAVALVGCGGGGGGGSSNNGGGNEPPPLSGRVLTGTVVSSTGGRGVDGVVIRLGSFLSATTANGGKFQLSVASDDDSIPYYFQVDPSGAGSQFPLSELVTYDGQTHYPDKVDLPVAVLNGQLDNLGTITIKEVIDDSMPPAPSYPSKNTLIYGRVVSQLDGAGIEGVSVSFGYTPARTATTGKKGYFVLNLGRDAAALPLFPSERWPPTFSINTATAVGSFPATLQVSFRSQTSAQGSIAVPQEILLASETTSLGTITVLTGSGGGGGGGDNPPPPPL